MRAGQHSRFRDWPRLGSQGIEIRLPAGRKRFSALQSAQGVRHIRIFPHFDLHLLKLNIFFGTLKVDLLVIITKCVLTKLFHFIVVVSRFCESHSTVSKSEFATVRSTGGLINPSSLFKSLFADVLWACQAGTFVRQVASSTVRVLFI